MKFPYRLILITNGKETSSMGFYHTEKQGLRAMYEKSKNQLKEVEFPTRYLNTTLIEPVKYELVLIKKRDEGDPLSSRIRNEYGEFVDYVSSKDMWLIIDKAPYEREETFWVYGYHPISDRKDFKFIFDELISPKATKRLSFLNLKLFRNKLLIESSDSTDLVLCKNVSDAIRLYNAIKDKCIKNKFKYVMFSGDCNSTPFIRDDTMERIHKLTNWDMHKIERNTTKTQNGRGKKRKQDG